MNQNDLSLLTDLSSMLVAGEDHNESLIEKILDTIYRRHPTLFYVYLLIEKDHLVLKSYATKRMKFMKKFVPIDVYSVKYPLSSHQTNLVKCVLQKKMIVVSHLRDMFCPVFKWPRILDIVQKGLKIRKIIAIPINLDGNTIGVVSFATEKANVSPETINILKLYVNLSAVALKNHAKFVEIQKLYHAEKETTSLLSHELNTPLAIASNQVELTRRELNAAQVSAKIKSNFNSLSAALNKVKDVTRSILDLHDAESTQGNAIHEFKICEILSQILQIMAIRAQEKGLTFIHSIQADLLKKNFRGGGVQFSQIATILIDNAIKYTDIGQVKMRISFAENRLRCDVTDTGPGVPIGKREIIFERFYRYKRRFGKRTEGLGLGLYIAKQISNKINGELSVSDNPEGPGARFSFSMPAEIT